MDAPRLAASASPHAKSPHFDRLMSIISSVFDAYSAVLFLQDHKSGEYRMASRFSLGDRINVDTVIAPGRGLAGWVLRHNQPLLVNDLVKKKGKIEYYDDDERQLIRAFMGCPLRQGEGVVCVDSKRSHCFSEKDQKILHLFVEYVQSLLHRFEESDATVCDTRYYQCLQQIQALRRQLSRWPDFLRQTLELLSATTGFEHVFFAVRDANGAHYTLEGSCRPLLPPGKELEPFDFGMGLVGWVFKNNVSFFTGEHETTVELSPLFGKKIKTPPVKSAVCLPLVVHRITRGVLGLAHPEPLAIDASMKSFLQMVADQLALFLENLYLRHRLQEAPRAIAQANLFS
ncbi:GAF domain-containing protein [Megalodesulfovibrio paquesii]